MPGEVFLYQKLKADKDFAELYARAREERADLMAVDIMKISDDGLNDTYEKDGVEHVKQDVIARSRLQVDTRKFLMAKMNPRVFGDRVALDVTTDEKPMTEEQQIEAIEGMIPQIAPLLVKLGWTPPETEGDNDD
jgi:hypothetical protein